MPKRNKAHPRYPWGSQVRAQYNINRKHLQAFYQKRWDKHLIRFSTLTGDTKPLSPIKPLRDVMEEERNKRWIKVFHMFMRVEFNLARNQLAEVTEINRRLRGSQTFRLIQQGSTRDWRISVTNSRPSLQLSDSASRPMLPILGQRRHPLRPLT